MTALREDIRMRDFAKKFYNSTKWRRCRKQFICERTMTDGGLCQRCHKEPGFIVHHRVYLTPSNIHDPAVSLDFRNLEYLCHECHDREHNSRLRVQFDENGRVMPPDDSEVSKDKFSDE